VLFLSRDGLFIGGGYFILVCFFFLIFILISYFNIFVLIFYFNIFVLFFFSGGKR